MEMTDEEEDLVKELASHLVEASPAKGSVLLREDSPEPPIRELIRNEERDDEHDETLLARALQEENHSVRLAQRHKRHIGSPEGLVALESVSVNIIGRRLDLEDAEELSVGSPASTSEIAILPVRQHKSVEDLREEQILIEFMEKASDDIPGNTADHPKRISAEETKKLSRDLRSTSTTAKFERQERMKLKILVKELKNALESERTKLGIAEARVADLYAQRFALAMICAASVPPLGFALLAHRYDLHDWEARSDALGVLLVVIVILFMTTLSLWKRARIQFEVASSTSTPTSQNNGELHPAKNSREDVPRRDSDQPGLRKRASKKGVSTKAEVIL